MGPLEISQLNYIMELASNYHTSHRNTANDLRAKYKSEGTRIKQEQNKRTTFFKKKILFKSKMHPAKVGSLKGKTI